MSISDNLMFRYYELLTDLTPAQIVRLNHDTASGKLHPIEAKTELARQIVSDLHSPARARDAAEEFSRVFRQRQAPSGMKVKELKRSPKPVRLTRLMVDSALVASNAEAQRMVKQGSVMVDGRRVMDLKADLNCSKPQEHI